MTTVTIVTEAVRAEATKWGKLHDDLAPLVTAVDNLDLNVTAFWIGEPGEINATIYSSAYNEFQAWLIKVLKAGVVEWGQIQTTLNRIANEYDKQDKIVEIDLEKFYSVMP
jgi:hypothetical protein